MLYKLYIQRFKEGMTPDYKILKDMIELYQENNVIVLGHWINKQDHHETVLITLYKDEAHYQDFISNMKADSRYQERQKYLGGIREEFMSMDLELNKYATLHPNEHELKQYINDVKSMVDAYAR